MQRRAHPLPLVVRILLLFMILLTGMRSGLSAQAYTDGPIQLQVKLRDINVTFNRTDQSVFGVGFSPDEETFYLWIQDNQDLDGTGWVGGACLQDNFDPPFASVDFNTTIFNYTYPTPTVPMYFDIRLEAWEDDIPSDQVVGFCAGGTRCGYNGNTCCGVFVFGVCVGVTESDDYHCVATPFKTQVDYRQGPPCQWYNHGYIIGTNNCGGNNFYQPRFDSYWRYTRGTSCANAIPLGNFGPASGPVSHFNSNECYANNWAPSPGNDVFYSVNITGTVGLKATLCSAASFDTYLYVLDASCNPIGSNDDFCAATSEVNIPLCTPGTYYIVVDGANAPDMGTFTLTLQNNPSIIVQANAGIDRTICLGTATTIGGSPSASGGASPYTYSWNPPTSLLNPTAANTSAYPPSTTQYILTVTDNNGCIDKDTMDLTVIPGPAVNLGPDQTICPLTFTTLDAGPGFVSYFWSTGASSQTVNVSYPGTYFVAVIDIAGCLGRDTIDVLNYPTSFVNLGPDTAICQGANLTLDAGPGYTSYTWSTGANTQSINVSVAGQYDVITMDANGCQAYDTINVTVNPLPAVNLGLDTTICPGETAMLIAPAGFPTYAWSTGSNNQAVFVSTAGNYSVTVTDVNGCQNSDSRLVSLFPAPALNLGPDAGLCIGSTRQLDAGPGFSSYLWSNNMVTQQVTAQFPGTYSVTVTDGNACSASDTILLSALATPVIELGNDTVICSGTSLTLDPGAGFSAYSWSTGASSQTINTTGTSVYAVTVTDGNGCQSSDSRLVIVQPLPTINLGPDTNMCAGGDLMLVATPGMTTYQWSTGSNNQFIVISSSGSYTVTVTDPFGCTNSDSRLVTYDPVVTGGLFSNDTTVCLGKTVLLDPGNGYTSYQWSGGPSSQYYIVGSPGTYSVTVTDTRGCLITDNVDVTLRKPPTISLGPDTHICKFSTRVLDAGPGFGSYLWSTGETSQSITVSEPGIYSVKAQYIQCESEDMIVLDKFCPDEIWIPNAFSPNSDAKNDEFFVIPNMVSTLQIRIFDKWGKMVYESEDPNFRWNGEFNGKALPEGVYSYELDAIQIEGLPVHKKGTVTLIR